MSAAQTARKGMKKRVRGMARGSLLLVGMLVILVLAGLAIIAARNVMLEFKVVGNFRAGEVSKHIAEDGLMGTLSIALTNPEGFRAYLLKNQKKIAPADVATSFFDTSSNGSFGRDYAGVGGATFVVTVSDPADTNRVPGYPVMEGFIWKRYKMVAAGYYGDQVTKNADDVLRNSSRQYITYSFVGPIPFEGGGGQ